MLIAAVALLAGACGGGGGGASGGNPPPPPPAQPGSVQFETSSLSVNEAAGTASLTITRTGGSDGAVSVAVASSDGSAVAGQDYTALNTTVSFAAGDAAAKTVTVSIADDTAAEADETLTLTLSAPTGGASLGSNASATLTIQDNDPPATPIAQNGLVFASRAEIDPNTEVSEVFRVLDVDPTNPPLKLHADLTPIPAASIGVFDLKVSPDQTRVAYLADRDGDGNSDLFVAALDGSLEVKVSGNAVSGGDVIDFQWAPDGSRLAFAGDLETNDVLALFTAPPDEQDNRIKVSGESASGGSAGDFLWSPDAALLAFVGDLVILGRRELFTVRPDGTGLKTVSGGMIANGAVTEFQWSPDSDSARLAFSGDLVIDDTVQLFIVPPDGSQRVTASGAVAPGRSVKDFRWSPSGSHLAFIGNLASDDVTELFTVTADGGGMIPVSGNIVAPHAVLEFLWSPTGSQLAFRGDLLNDGVSQLFTARPDGSTGRTLISGSTIANGDVRQDGFQWPPMVRVSRSSAIW